MSTPNGSLDPMNGDASNALPGTELAPKVYDAEFVTDDAAPGRSSAVGPWTAPPLPVPRWRARWRRWAFWFAGTAARAWRSGPVMRARSVAAYRVRKLPQDVVRLAWFVLRGNWRWLVKFWNWATYADLRADARNARLAGDPEARRAAQELIRSDAKARWAKVGITVHRTVVTVRVLAPVAVLLWAVDSFMDRSAMWPWLASVYTGLDTTWTVLATMVRTMIIVAPVVWVIATAFEGRDKTPGAGWLVHPDRDDADSWIDERMISKALAHLGIAPLNTFFKGGGQLHYSVAARVDGDGTYAQIRLPLGVTADMVADRRDKLAANLGRAKLETWPTEGPEAGILDLWVADKGKLSGGAGEWPLLHDGQADLFEGVPFGLTQRGLIVNAPLMGANWLVGGRPGQGKSSVLRTLLLGAALDPTAELWAFVMGESPDFAPFQPRLARYRMGMDDAVADAATQALADLLAEMERRGKVLGAQPGSPPKVSRKLADRRELGLHPLVCAIDECHELFQHPKFGKRAADLAVRLIKRGRKYGIVLLLATQSPTKDSIPREITRNISCAVAFSVADQVANDGLLGTGKYRAGIRATDLRMHTDRGTCVAVGVTDATFELVRTFYVPFEDGIDHVSPVIARAMALLAQNRRAVTPAERTQLEAIPVDHLADIAAALRGEPRVRTQVVLARLIEHNSVEYEGWSLSRLAAVLAAYHVPVRKSDGVKVIRATDITRALATRTDADIERVERGETGEDGRDADRDARGGQGVLPDESLPPSPWADQYEHGTGTQSTQTENTTENPRNRGSSRQAPDSLPHPDGGGRDDS
jgi:DNA segregation ATPase FtsK/SpoIIIE, S-DNA-T family